MSRLLIIAQVAFRVAASLTDVLVDTHRRKHLAYLMADQGALVNPESARNLPKQVSASREFGQTDTLVTPQCC